MSGSRATSTMAASESESGRVNRFDAAQRRIEKSAIPKVLYDPSKPTQNFDRTRLAIRLMAKTNGLDYFAACPNRPTVLPRAMRSKSAKAALEPKTPAGDEAVEPTLEAVQAAYDQGNSVFFDIVHRHIDLKTDALAMEIERKFEGTADGVGYYKWFTAKGDRSTPGRQKALRGAVNNFKLSAKECASAHSIDMAVGAFFASWCLVKGNDPSDESKVSDAIDLVLDAFPAEHQCAALTQQLSACNTMASRWQTFDAFQTELHLFLEKHMKDAPGDADTLLPFQSRGAREKQDWRRPTNSGEPAVDDEPAVYSASWTSGPEQRPPNACDTCDFRGCKAKAWESCWANIKNKPDKLPLHNVTNRFLYALQLVQFAARKMSLQNMKGVDIPKAIRVEFKKQFKEGDTSAPMIEDMSEADIAELAAELAWPAGSAQDG